MIICHALYYKNSFCLWAEASFSLKKISRKKGEKTHLFQSEIKDFDKALKTLHLEKSKPDEILSLELPTLHGSKPCPLPSSKILCEEDLEIETIVLEPWEVRVSNPTFSSVHRFFGNPASHPGIFMGSDVLFWGKVFSLATRLIKAQQVIPSVTKEGSTFRGVWHAVFDYETEELFQSLIKTMPSACIISSEQSAEQSIREVIHLFVDQGVRQSISQKHLLPALSKTKIPTSHDAWLFSLCAKDNEITFGEEKDRKTLLEEVQSWAERSSKNNVAGCRLCLEIEAPTIKSEETIRFPGLKEDLWALTLTLQSTTDPSLRIPLRDVWENPSHYKIAHQKEDSDLREFLLKSLSYLSDYAPSLSPFLEKMDALPKTFFIPIESAFSFLNEEVGALLQAGFGVFLPSWWRQNSKKSPLTTGVKAKSSLQAQGQISLEELVHFKWEVALLDQTISEAELTLLASLKTPLVQVRGEWVMLSAEDIGNALKMYQEPQSSMKTQDFLRMALTRSHEQIPGTRVTKISATGVLEELIQSLTAEKTYQDIEVDPQFKGQLRPYQKSGMSWLFNLKNWGMGACLADDMGLGKTVQTLAFIQKDFQIHKGKVLLICPTSVIGNWEKESKKFTPDLRVGTYHGSRRSQGEDFQEFIKNHDLIITSYALVQRDIETLKEISWQGVILDEAQNIKNAATKQFKSVKSLSSFYRIALTGTPVENNVGDLWALMDFLNPGLLGSQTKFKNIFFTPIQKERDEAALQKLKSLTSPFILRRLKTDKAIIQDLPDKIETKVYGYLTKEQASLYKAVTEEALKAIEETKGNSINRKGLILGMLTTLKQICNHPAHFLKDHSEIGLRSGKMERLTEMIEEIRQSKEKILIFTQFTEMGGILKSHLQEQFGEEVLFLHGAVSKEARDKMVERFQSEDTSSPNIFILSLRAGGTGITLTAANHVFHFDRWWNPAVEDQASDRAFRIGQTKTVQVHKFVCRGTLEEKIDDLIEQKKELAQSVIGAGEGWVSDLSVDALREMVTLRETSLMK